MRFCRLFKEVSGQRYRCQRIFAKTIRTNFVGPALRDRSAANDDLHAWAKSVASDGLDHAFLPGHGGGQQSRNADDVRVNLTGFEGEGLKRDVHAQIEHFKTIGGEHGANKGFTDLVDVALHCP